MADFTQMFLQGLQAGQSQKEAMLKHQKEQEDRDLQRQMLKHQMDRLKIEDQVKAREMAVREAQIPQLGQTPPPLQIPDMLGRGTMPAPAELPPAMERSVPLPAVEGMAPASQMVVPTIQGLDARKAQERAAETQAREGLSKVFVPANNPYGLPPGFVDKEYLTQLASEARENRRDERSTAAINAADARLEKLIASREKIEQERRAGESQEALPPDHEDVTFLLSGGTADKLSVRTRSRAFEAAKAAGGIAGTGFVPSSAAQLSKFSFLHGDALAKATRLKQLLEDPKTAAAMKDKLGPIMGRLVQGTKEWSYVGQDTATKEAFDLFKDLSDAELRARSGAAISPGEYDRIVGFTIDPTKQLDSNKTNLTRMINKITEELKVMGASPVSTIGRFKVEVVP